MKVSIFKKELRFKQPAKTSKLTYHTHTVWYIVLQSSWDSSKIAVGECAPLPHLSIDYREDYETMLQKAAKELEQNGTINREAWKDFPSILFGVESAIRHFTQGDTLWESAYARGEAGIPTNGLIWMSDFENMQQQVEEKLKQGFRCIKIKIGATDFEDELRFLSELRSKHPSSELELRVDANGAFSVDEAAEKLERLSKLSLHSIEQPIAAANHTAMRELCKTSSLPIALDEELIGLTTYDEKSRMLDTVSPQYIVLKPTLHGGISGSEEWIKLAEERGIGYWITSALESNVGLNVLAQWVATLQPQMPQGLGTGLLYTNNSASNMYFEKDRLFLSSPISYKMEDFTESKI